MSFVIRDLPHHAPPHARRSEDLLPSLSQPATLTATQRARQSLQDLWHGHCPILPRQHRRKCRMAMRMQMQQVMEHHPFTESDRAALRRAVQHPELAPSSIDRLNIMAARYRRAGRPEVAVLCHYLAQTLWPAQDDDIADLMAYRAARRTLLPHIARSEPVELILDLFGAVTATNRLRILQVARARMPRVHIVSALGVVGLFHSGGSNDPGLRLRYGLADQTVILSIYQRRDNRIDNLASRCGLLAWSAASRQDRYASLDLTNLNIEHYAWLEHQIAGLHHRVVHAPWRPAPCSEGWRLRRFRPAGIVKGQP